MKKILLVSTLVILTLGLRAQTNRQYLLEKIDTTNLDLAHFTSNIIANATTDYQKAQVILNWLSNRLEWKATDYQNRSVNQILARGGGNCFELAKVYMAMIRAIKIPFRPITEINLHIYSASRQKTAAEKVLQQGNRMSVFGLQHNDHRWLEIYDAATNQWQPVDPSMNVIGVEQWLKARAWFGERITIDTSITNDMIVPFGIFVVGDPYSIQEDRTKHYLSDQLNQLYGNQLQQLPGWKEWNLQLATLSPLVKEAFEAKINLHTKANLISELASIYERLKQSYLKLNKQQP